MLYYTYVDDCASSQNTNRVLRRCTSPHSPMRHINAYVSKVCKPIASAPKPTAWGTFAYLTPPCKRGQNTTPHRTPKPAGGIGPWGRGNSAPPGIGPSDPACPAWRCRKPCQARNRHGGGFGHARTAPGKPGRVWNS